MKRRHYLGALTLAAVAGCSDPEPADEDEPTPEDDGETPDDGTDTPADDETPEEPEASEPPAEEEPPLTEDEQTAEARILEGDEQIQAALTAYAEAGPGESFLDTRSSAAGFRASRVERRLREADDWFVRARRLASDDQRERIDRLRRVVTTLTWVARTQERLCDSFEAFTDVVVAHQGDVVSPVAWRRLRERLEAAQSRRETLADVGDAAAADASEVVTTAQLTDKLEQLDSEHDAFDRLLDARAPVTEGHDEWVRATRLYTRRSWISAEGRFETATERFETARERLEAPPTGDGRFDDRYRTFEAIVTTLSEAGTEYRASAAAYADRNSDEGDSRRLAGRRILRNEDAVDGLPSVRRLDEFEP